MVFLKQKSAGVLIYIRDALYPRFKVKLDKFADVHETSLSTLSTFMLAQAAECFYEKANDGNKEARESII